MKQSVAIILLLACAALADEPKKVYQPVGAPADPKVDVRWNVYHDYAASTGILKKLAEAHPKHVKLGSLGKSFGGREMWVMTISADVEAEATDTKPAMWIDGGIHANELQATEVVLYTAWYLAEMRGRNAFVDRLLAERTFYLMPMMSPDARDAHMHEANTTHSPRTGMRPFDDDRDGRIDEDPADDLDGDGHIVMMRIADPNGQYTPHDRLPQMMTRIDPEHPPAAEKRYTLLGMEGVDNDGDGRVNEDGPGSYDPNRNWAWQWSPQYVQRGAGRYPFSIPEVRMVARFIMSRPNIAGAQSYHNTGGMILRGPGQKDRQYARPDLAVYDEVGKLGERLLPGYRYLALAADLYPGDGVEIDWFYGMRGVVAYTNELFTPFNFDRNHDHGHGFVAGGELPHRFNRDLLLGDGFVDWHEVDHPKYGKVELGGFKKSWLRQPPSFMLEEEAHRNMAFTLHHADAMPRIRVEDVTVRRLDGGVREVTATIANERPIPTRLAHDVKHAITPPDRVRIAGENTRVLAALVSRDRFFDRAREQEYRPHDVRLDAVPGRGVVYVRWLVTGQGPLTVTARSVKGGADAMTTIAGPGKP